MAMESTRETFPIPPPDPAFKKKAERAFWNAAGITALLAICIAVPLTILGHYWLHGSPPIAPPTFLILTILYLSLFGGRAYCRRKGLSLERRVTESLVCRASTTLEGVAEPAELSTNRSEFGWGALILTALFWGSLWLVRQPDSEAAASFVTPFLQFIGIPTFGAFALYLATMWITNSTLIARVDTQGIHFTRHFRRRLVRWEEIEQVELVTQYNVVGDFYSPYCVLKNRDGKSLGRFDLPSANAARREAFIKTLRQFVRCEMREPQVAAPLAPERTYTTSVKPEVQRLGRGG